MEPTRLTPRQRRLLDVVATAIILPPLSNAPQLLGSTFQPIFAIPNILLVLSVILVVFLFRGDRRFFLPACIPPLAVVAGHIHFVTMIPVKHSDEGWHLTPSRYLLEHSTQILIAVVCIASLLYVFTSSRREANVA